MSWKANYVDTAGDVGQYSDIAVDAVGHVHIAYYDGGDASLRYATDTSGVWTTTFLADVGTLKQYPSLTLDASGKVHVVCGTSWTEDLLYVTNSFGNWLVSVVDGAVDEAYKRCSVALDADGYVHVTYHEYGSIKYATNKLGGWKLDPVGSGGPFNSVVVGLDGTIHVASYKGTPPFGPNSLKYTTGKPGSWSEKVVDPDIGWSPITLALDTAGAAHLSYYGADGIMYATNKMGSWKTEFVAAVPDVFGGTGNSLALDKQGNVHVSFYDKSTTFLKYATKADGYWAQLFVDASADVGLDNSIAADGDGRLHISYYDKTGGNLRYALGEKQCVTTADGVDRNCDGLDGVDEDGDGVASVPSGGTDCDDAEPSIFPGAQDSIGDGKDQDCDGKDG